jgi:hypothetical protein
MKIEELVDRGSQSTCLMFMAWKSFVEFVMNAVLQTLNKYEISNFSYTSWGQKHENTRSNPVP